jgi:hypothetical protein
LGVTTLTITLGETNIRLSNIKQMNIKPFGFSWEERLSKQEENK